MNNKRLSSRGAPQSVDREFLQSEIDKLLLNSNSNIELMADGRKYIKSLKRYEASTNIGVELKDKEGEVINSFTSLSDCAKFLGISRSTVTRRLQKKQTVLYGNQRVYISPQTNNIFSNNSKKFSTARIIPLKDLNP
jgi:hypothetical protein